MSITFSISRVLVAETLNYLVEAGQRNCEGIVLWLAPRASRRLIVRVVVPLHKASDDYFHIPPEGNRALQQLCRNEKLIVEAQVHTHPHEAFHSRADDRLSLVRHVDALSVVLPDFAAHTTVETFLRDSASFMLTSDDCWRQVPLPKLTGILRIT